MITDKAFQSLNIFKMNLIEKINQTIASNKLFKKGDRVIVGVSGGPDSICLLHVLNALKYDLGISLYVAHVNHGIRKDAGGDQRFVEKTSVGLNLPVVVKTLKKSDFNSRRSFENTARELRIEFFLTAAKKYRAKMIALGHNQDDLAETMLMRLIRGTGLLGMSGILPQKTIFGLSFVRPLLDVSRGEIETFLSENGIPYRNDPSNRDLKFLRNQIRWELIPFLNAGYNKSIVHSLARLSDTVAQDYDFLFGETRKHLKNVILVQKKNSISVRIPKLRKLHCSLQRMVIRHCFDTLVGDFYNMSFSNLQDVEQLISNAVDGSTLDICRGVKVKILGNTLCFVKT